jgi:hypothetical protein
MRRLLVERKRDVLGQEKESWGEVVVENGSMGRTRGFLYSWTSRFGPFLFGFAPPASEGWTFELQRDQLKVNIVGRIATTCSLGFPRWDGTRAEARDGPGSVTVYLTIF